MTKELARLASGRPCGPNKWARQTVVPGTSGQILQPPFNSVVLASLSLMDSQGKGQQKGRASIGYKGQQPLSQLLGRWKPAFGISGGPSPPQPHQACPATPPRLTQASLSSYAKETGNFYSAAWSGSISTLLGRGPGRGQAAQPQNRPCILEVAVKGHWEWGLWSLASLSVIRKKPRAKASG